MLFVDACFVTAWRYGSAFIHYPAGFAVVLRSWLRSRPVLRRSSSLGSKERLEKLTALLFKKASNHLHSMIESAFGWNVNNRAAGTGFGIPCSEYQSRNASLHNRSGTHGARL